MLYFLRNEIMKRIIIPILLIISVVGCLVACKTRNSTNEIKKSFDTIFVNVRATLETDQVPGDTVMDAADDPAIWYNKENPSSSLVFGTDKKGGIMVFNLAGKLIKYHKTGLPNNIDIRRGFPIGNNRKADIAGFSNRASNTIEIYEIHADGDITSLLPEGHKPNFTGEVYGFCLFHNMKNSEYYAIINSKDGEIEVWKINGSSGIISLEFSRSFKTETQPEGMVADDINEILYVGEEDKGIWRFDLRSKSPDGPVLIIDGAIESNNALKDDIEGLAICYTGEGGYLVASSQGNNSYAIFKLTGDNSYIGSFRINDGKIDGTEDTDGIDLLNLRLNDTFPNGVFIAQDGKNTDENGKIQCQNFKFVNLNDIILNLPK